MVKEHSSYCYHYIVKTLRYNKTYSSFFPVTLRAEIPVPVFNELPSLEIREFESHENKSDLNEKDCETEGFSVRKEFDHQELNNLVRNLGLSKKASKFLPSGLHEKNFLEKVRFYNTFEMMLDLCIAITYVV